MIGRSARWVWGGVTLGLLILLVGSIALSRDAVKGAEEEAHNRAETLASAALLDTLTPEMMQGDILGPDYRDVNIAVQAGILSDDRVEQVRIWKPDGDLIFSTAQRDNIAEYVAVDDPQIKTAAAGTTASVITDPTVPAPPGLEGSDEQLFATFVPLRLADELSVSGVVQIDQRYSDIRAEALNVWRPIQIAVAVLLPAAIVLLVLSFRKEAASRTVAGPAGTAVAGRARDDRALRHAKERASAAERAAREAETRLSEVEKQLREANKAEAAPSMLGKVEELDLKLRASEAEREQNVAELQRLRAATSEAERKEAEASKHALDAEAKRGELEAKLIAAEAAGMEAASAHTRAAEAERDELRAKVAELEEALAGAGAAAPSGDEELPDSEEEVAQEVADLEARIRTVELEAADAERRAASAEEARAALEAQLEQGEAAALATAGGVGEPSDLQERVAELEAARRTDIADLQKAQESLVNTQLELANANRRLKEAEGHVRELDRGTAVAPRSEPEPAPVPDYVNRQADRPSREPESVEPESVEPEPAPVAQETSSLAARLSSRRRESGSATGVEAQSEAEPEPAAEPAPGSEAEPQPPAEEEAELSLRERLARAAAARRRGPL